jgi:serine/threonine protein kinase
VDEHAEEQQTTTNIGPLKWMAPEQMERLAYSKASDVFAFGVLLFEVWACEAPWKGVANLVVAKRVTNGERMDVPDDVPQAFAALMRDCWMHKPSARPQMSEVQRRIRTLLPDESYSSSSSSSSRGSASE